LNQSFFGGKTIGWWGTTETITHGTIGSVHLPNRHMSMDRPAPEYGIFVKRDAGAPVEPGEIGHLLVRGIPGLSLFHSYLHNRKATEASYDERRAVPDGRPCHAARRTASYNSPIRTRTC
jgi:crotonobetaine/carnitine-CoA ligase